MIRNGSGIGLSVSLTSFYLDLILLYYTEYIRHPPILTVFPEACVGLWSFSKGGTTYIPF